MKHIFVDTNILLDFLSDRKPYSDQAAKLFQLAAKKRIKLYAASVSFNNIYYIVRKQQSHSRAMKFMDILASAIKILPVDENVITKAIASGFNDFEDAIQNFSAQSHSDIELIVTRNEKDFKKSSLAVLSPETLLKTLDW